MEQPRLSLLQSSMITPATTSPRQSIFLSNADIMMRCLPYNRRILFYRWRPEDYRDMIEVLKRSLCTVLVDFYPFAGRLKEGADGRLEVVCNDLGAEFVEASVEGVSFSELAGDNFDLKPFFEMLTPWATFSAEKHQYIAPLLSIQITRFDCGGISLGVAHSHVLADGHSLWHFITSWAECARGVPISIGPLHERTLLRVDNPSKTKAAIGLEEIEGERCYQLDYAKSTKSHVFSFTKEMMRRLKERAAESEGEDQNYTSYEVLCAHVWRCASRASCHAREQQLSFTSVANMRRKMDPALPDGYFGNALLWGRAIARAGELEKEELAKTAARIKGAGRAFTSSAVVGLLHWLELYGPDDLFRKTVLNRPTQMRVSSSPRFPVFDADFGWGKPLAARPAVVEEPGKIVFFPGPQGPGSVDLCLALPQPAMSKLENDPVFIRSLAAFNT